MRAPFWTVLIAIATTAAIAACSSDPGSKTAGQATAAPAVTIPPDVKLLAAPTSEPQDLPGVSTTELSSRERHAYWRWVSQLYAPCPEVAVSIADCIAQDRPCAACVPAAEFLVARARAGAAQNEAIAAFSARFGRDVKKIDLADSPASGPANAPVTLVIWSDFECPACGYAVPLIEEILTRHANDVRLVHKLYPLKSHPHSRPAARAAIAARKQGKYWEMEKMLFSHQKHLEDADLAEYARNIGLDMARFAKDFMDPKNDDIIERDRAEAEKQGLSGTPFIIINGREFDLGFFKVDRDLESWITSEVAIHNKDAERRAAMALGSGLTGGGLGPVSPLATGVPQATAAPAASAAPSASAPSAPPR